MSGRITNKFPNFFLAGFQKTASTWIYYCLKEHPEVYVPDKDALHFFTINNYKGLGWYQNFYQNCNGEKAIVDPTPSYFRDPLAIKKIWEFNPNAKFIISLRNPIDRAFSHYWHEKKKGKISFSFEEAISYNDVGNYDLYNNWIIPGFYHHHIENFLEVFSKDQLLILIYENLKKNPKEFLTEILTFLEVDESFEPSVLNKIVNKAGKPTNKTPTKKIYDKIKHIIPSFVKSPMKKIFNSNFQPRQNGTIMTEYDRGMAPEIRLKLQEIFSDEIEKLEKLVEKDLSFWH